MLNITMNGKKLEVPEDITILEAAAMHKINIPHLCYLKGTHSFGTCRICVVEVEGMRNLQASCMAKVREGMVVHTKNPRVRQARKVLYELLLSDHNRDCLSCARNQSCELQQLGFTLGVTDSRLDGERASMDIDETPAIVRDSGKCILCRRCVTACRDIQKVGAIDAQNRGFETVISPSMDLPLDQTACAMCGQCTVVCPTGALQETDGIGPVWRALQDTTKHTVVQVAPAVRAALGEEFGYPTGTAVTGQMASALKELGFNDVFDTNFAADLTIIEEGTELLGRLDKALKGLKSPDGMGALPMITSCSPGWIKHIEHAFPGQLGHLSSCKSPHTMMGALVKSYYAEKIGVHPQDVFVVSVMPCTAKKYEVQRPEMEVDGVRDVDAVLTTRELARMIRQAGIEFKDLPKGDFDKPLGLSTGAADIFGVTGGVMEAALRTVYELVTGRELPFENLHVAPIVGLEQVKTATVAITDTLPEYSHLEGAEVKIAVTSGLEGADILMEEVAQGTSPYHFIEVMGCPGGCINGGGQPRNYTEGYREKRAAALYGEDEGKKLRKSHENPDLMQVYEEYIGKPNGKVAHHLLHTTYTPRGLYNQHAAQGK